MLFTHLLGRIVRRGRIEFVDPKGRLETVGQDESEADITVRVRMTDSALPRRLLLNPQLALGEAYMDGTLVLERGTIADLLEILMRALGTNSGVPLYRVTNALRFLGRRLAQANPIGRARENVAHHYDLSRTLYDTFLDPDRQYSCAYFQSSEDTLEVAQAKKKRHIGAKLALEPGMRVLDIGSGWGGLGLYLAREAEAQVTGVTLSTEQHALSSERALKAGLADKVRFELQDYRELQGSFDRIVSVGMFEHVGVGHYDEYFRHIARLLERDGVALIHAIGRSDGPGATNPWIAKYIFPGGYTPALSEVLPAIERAGLYTTDVEILRLHYAETLKAWRDAFCARWDEMAELYDERFCRMWEFYLAGSEMGFRHQGLMVFQIQVAKSVDALPLTRDYMIDWERSHPIDGAKAPERAQEQAA